jgi:hypothetical protein
VSQLLAGVQVSTVAPDTSLKAPFESVKLCECIGKGGCEDSSRLAVQRLGLDQPGTNGRIPEGALKVASGLGVVVGALPASSVTSRYSQSSDPDVVHDHIRLRQHQIAAISRIGLCIGARRVQHLGTTKRGETMGGSSCGSELGPRGASTKVISDGCPYANRKVLIKGVGENLLPSAQSWRLRRPGSPVTTPCA